MLVLYRLFVLVILARASFAQTDSCREGFYGDNCELICSETCRPFQTFPCDKNTGQCSEGCQGGYFGDKCDKQCSCASGVCYQQNGECLEISATTDRTTRNTTTIRNGSPEINEEPEEPVCVCDGEQDVWLVVGIIFIVLTVILFLILIGMPLFKTARRRMEQSKRAASGTRNRRSFKLHCCTGTDGKDNETTGQQVPLTEGNTAPVSELGGAHTDQAAPVAQDQASSKNKKSDRHVTKQNEERERLCRKIKELEDEKRLMEENHKTEKSQLEESHKAEKSQLEESNKAEKSQLEESYKAEKSQLEESHKAEHQTLLNFGLPANSTIHLMKIDKLDPQVVLQCPDLKFDKETVNDEVAHVDDDMMLINSPKVPNPDGNNSRRFKNVHVTTCTSPLVTTGFYQYFEAVFYISLKHKFEEGHVVMQIALCDEKNKDRDTCSEDETSCCVVKAVGCAKHKGICLVFTHSDKHVNIQKLDNPTSTNLKVNIGFRLNKENTRLGVYDFGLPAELWKTTINIGDRIWPMFGFCDHDRASVKVKLRSGRDIEMSRKKKDTIKPKEKH